MRPVKLLTFTFFITFIFSSNASVEKQLPIELWRVILSQYLTVDEASKALACRKWVRIYRDEEARVYDNFFSDKTGLLWKTNDRSDEILKKQSMKLLKSLPRSLNYRFINHWHVCEAILKSRLRIPALARRVIELLGSISKDYRTFDQELELMDVYIRRKYRISRVELYMLETLSVYACRTYICSDRQLVRDISKMLGAANIYWLDDLYRARIDALSEHTLQEEESQSMKAAMREFYVSLQDINQAKISDLAQYIFILFMALNLVTWAQSETPLDFGQMISLVLFESVFSAFISFAANLATDFQH